MRNLNEYTPENQGEKLIGKFCSLTVESSNEELAGVLLDTIAFFKSCNTVTDDPNADFGKAFEFIGKLGTELGYNVNIIPFDTNYKTRYTAEITLPEYKDKGFYNYIMHAHLDIVGYDETDKRGNGRIYLPSGKDKDTYFGRGVNDMLTQVACTLIHLAQIKNLDIKIDKSFKILITSTEEKGFHHKEKVNTGFLATNLFLDLEPTGDISGVACTEVLGTKRLIIPFSKVAFAKNLIPSIQDVRNLFIKFKTEYCLGGQFSLRLQNYQDIPHLFVEYLNQGDGAELPEHIKSVMQLLNKKFAIAENMHYAYSVTRNSSLAPSISNQLKDIIFKHFKDPQLAPKSNIPFEGTRVVYDRKSNKHSIAFNFLSAATLLGSNGFNLPYAIFSMPEVVLADDLGRHSWIEAAKISNALKVIQVLNQLQTIDFSIEDEG